MDHKTLALQSDSYFDYLDGVATSLNPMEILQAILWHMDEDDKRNLLVPACMDCDFETLNSLEYFELVGDKYYADF